MDIINEIYKQIENESLWENWHIKEELGSGAFSRVYKIEAVRNNRTDVSALKIEPITADGQIFTDESQKRSVLEKKKRFVEAETSTMHRLKDCPNIVNYEDESMRELFINGKFKGYYFLIRMELLTNVYDMMRSCTFDFSEYNVMRLALDICRGLKAVHDINTIHRDIKPSNFFVSATGVYKLGDFNISKETASAHSFAGTEGYIAPEVYMAKANPFNSYTKQADIYSLGICLYQMMNKGMFPFQSDDCDVDDAIDIRMSGKPFDPPSEASTDFATVIMKACMFEPMQRYQSVDNMIRDIEAILNGGSDATQYAGSSYNQSQSYNDNPPQNDQYGTVPPPAPVNPPAPPAPTCPPVPPDPPASSHRNIAILTIVVILFAIVLVLAGMIFLGNRGSKNSDNSTDSGFVSPDFEANIVMEESAPEQTLEIPQEPEQTPEIPEEPEPEPEQIPEIPEEPEPEPITEEIIIETAPPVEQADRLTDFKGSILNTSASSQLKDESFGDEKHVYSPAQAIDSDLSTCWCEGRDDNGTGEEITIGFNDTYLINEIWIWNGLCTNSELYYKNSRLHNLTIILSDGTEIPFECSDGWDNRKVVIAFSEPVETSSVTIRIDSVFEGNKYTDTCISEIYIP